MSANSLTITPSRIKDAAGRLGYEINGLEHIASKMGTYGFSMARLTAVPIGDNVQAVYEQALRMMKKHIEQMRYIEERLHEVADNFQEADEMAVQWEQPSIDTFQRSSSMTFAPVAAMHDSPLAMLYGVPPMFSRDISWQGRAYSFMSLTSATTTKTSTSVPKKEKVPFWDTPGIGNFKDEFKFNKDQLSYKAEGSFLDTAPLAGGKKMPLNARILTGAGEMNIPISDKQLVKDLATGSFIGGKAEVSAFESTLKHDDIEAKLKVGTAEAKAGIENYSVGAGAEASAVKLETKKKLFTFFGYSPLEEWFGISPYVGVDISLGGTGVSASVGLQNEVYAADGIGVGVKFGVDIKDD
ncbi:hypothetical protein [Aneurinibacillus migulanus]|uniref:hypothetical protein n=1 Tax=Aneurinibacillus migulanus TaxID=47500 RepID=UPI00209FADB8|nr:hypothetical protein [Aneurinibacillus migulanus]MCP1357225.1 hypothetical protein [Aneurinibacillus migulanus]